MIDHSSGTWHLLRRWAESQLDLARKKNDAVGLSEFETAALRGEIRMLKRLLDLPNEATRGVAAEPDL